MFETIHPIRKPLIIDILKMFPSLDKISAIYKTYMNETDKSYVIKTTQDFDSINDEFTDLLDTQIDKLKLRKDVNMFVDIDCISRTLKIVCNADSLSSLTDICKFVKKNRIDITINIKTDSMV